jgi:hypothetical protein
MRVAREAAAPSKLARPPAPVLLQTETGGKAMARKELRPALAYLRTSSAANVGADKDSGKRQRTAID